jgi:hypothetical protein
MILSQELRTIKAIRHRRRIGAILKCKFEKKNKKKKTEVN